MLAISEPLVTVLASIVVAGMLALIIVIFVRLLRTTSESLGRSGTAWLTGIGALISMAGVVDLLWTQASLHAPFPRTAEYRWQVATNSLIVVALGLLVAIAAQILQAVRGPAAD